MGASHVRSKYVATAPATAHAARVQLGYKRTSNGQYYQLCIREVCGELSHTNSKEELS